MQVDKNQPTMTDLARPQPGALKPRAIAVLCALRCAARTMVAIRCSIGDRSSSTTADLLRDMRSMRLVGQQQGDERWYLADDGVAWLETNGLAVEMGARL